MNIEIEKPIEENKVKIKLSRYANNPEYKARHKAYMLQYIDCACGCKVQRCNTSKHNKSNKHKLIMNAKQNQQPKTFDKKFLLKKLLEIYKTEREEKNVLKEI